MAKAWSEPDSSDSSFEDESPVQPVTKKRKETTKCSRELEKEFLKLPVPPVLPLCNIICCIIVMLQHLNRLKIFSQ